MLNLTGNLKIFVHTSATDMRRGINGLSGLVRSEFHSDPSDGSLFVFINRRRDRMKILHFDGGGYWLYYRLLEAGTFEELKTHDNTCRSLRMNAVIDCWVGSGGCSLLAIV